MSFTAKAGSFVSALLLLCVLTGVRPALAQTGDVPDPAFAALSSGNVYVDPQLHHIDQQTLEQAALQGQANPHTVVKMALLKHLPGGFAGRDAYCGRLHSVLNLGRSGLIVVVFSGPGAGVSVSTTALDPSDCRRLAQEAVPRIRADETAGIAGLAQAVAGAVNNREYRGSAILWIIFLFVVIAVVVLLTGAARRKRQELAALRPAIDALRGNVLSGIEYLDGYIDVLPKNNPDSDQVRLFRQSASDKFEQAVKILDRATELSDLGRAQALLDRAQADVQQARRYLDRATGGTGHIPGDEAVRPAPLPSSQPEVDRIPARQRGVSFFSSRPAPLGALVPVTITVNGQSRQVLVTPEEADELRQGRMPAVRAFAVNGRQVPWYEYPDYDPYRDYWRYDNMGWGGFGGGLLAGFVGAELLTSLYAPPLMGGGMPYAFATDAPFYQGYADPSAGYGYDNIGGGDFLSDNGGSDFGGGGDFGGGDFGGGDFGGGDFGGGDFGGGGGDFGGS